jgi:hypothetical protein
VIAREHHQHAILCARFGWLPDQPELHGEVFDTPERSRRLRLAVDARAQCSLMGTIEGSDRWMRPMRI